MYPKLIDIGQSFLLQTATFRKKIYDHQNPPTDKQQFGQFFQRDLIAQGIIYEYFDFYQKESKSASLAYQGFVDNCIDYIDDKNIEYMACIYSLFNLQLTENQRQQREQKITNAHSFYETPLFRNYLYQDLKRSCYYSATTNALEWMAQLEGINHYHRLTLQLYEALTAKKLNRLTGNEISEALYLEFDSGKKSKRNISGVLIESGFYNEYKERRNTIVNYFFAAFELNEKSQLIGNKSPAEDLINQAMYFERGCPYKNLELLCNTIFALWKDKKSLEKIDFVKQNPMSKLFSSKPDIMTSPEYDLIWKMKFFERISEVGFSDLKEELDNLCCEYQSENYERSRGDYLMAVLADRKNLYLGDVGFSNKHIIEKYKNKAAMAFDILKNNAIKSILEKSRQSDKKSKPTPKTVEKNDNVYSQSLDAIVKYIMGDNYKSKKRKSKPSINKSFKDKIKENKAHKKASKKDNKSLESTAKKTAFSPKNPSMNDYVLVKEGFKNRLLFDKQELIDSLERAKRIIDKTNEHPIENYIETFDALIKEIDDTIIEIYRVDSKFNREFLEGLCLRVDSLFDNIRPIFQKHTKDQKTFYKFQRAFNTAFRNEKLVFGKRKGGIIDHPLKESDRAMIESFYHYRIIKGVDKIYIDQQERRLETNETLIFYVTKSSLSGYLFDISVHIAIESDEEEQASIVENDPIADEFIDEKNEPNAPEITLHQSPIKLDMTKWFDTFIPLTVMHIPRKK